LISYGLIWINNYPYFLVFAPIYIFVASAALMAVIGRTDGFLAVIGELHWGVISCVFFLGHVAFLMRTPEVEAPEAGPAGLVFFLFLITGLNDITQYFWGRAIGRHKIAPRVSPNKTWEGAVGGCLTTTALFVWLAPYFTPLRDLPVLLLIGGVLPVLGFLGDITMSAIKRDLGVKDASNLLPGHGGILDRVDSLTFTAPWYFHMLAIFALQRF
jgi:phosphatidate cytidylyltransferase